MLANRFGGCVYLGNLDAAMSRFMVRYFPSEVKHKEREHEAATAMDIYVPGSHAQYQCAIM